MKYLLLQNFYGAIAIPLHSTHALSDMVFGSTEGYGAAMKFTPKTEPLEFTLMELGGETPDPIPPTSGPNDIPF